MKRNKNMSDLNMMDEYEVQGHWWLPEEKDKYVSGLLYSDEKGIYLDTLKSFTDFIVGDDGNYEFIHGLTVNGEKVTLVNNYEQNLSIAIGGINDNSS